MEHIHNFARLTSANQGGHFPGRGFLDEYCEVLHEVPTHGKAREFAITVPRHKLNPHILIAKRPNNPMPHEQVCAHEV